MADETKRVIDQDTDTSLSAGDYVMVDSQAEGTRKFDLGSELSGIKEDYSDLEDRVEALEEGGGGEGLTDEERALILSLFSKAAYAEDDAGDAYEQLSDLWSVYSVTWSGTGYTHGNTSVSARGGSTFVSTVTADGGHTISTVVATMGGVTVQGAWNNGTVTIPNVTGDIVITVTTIQAEVSSISAVYTQSGTVYDTDSLDSLKSDLVVTATYVDQSTYVVPSAEYTLSGTLTAGTSTITVAYGGKTTTFTVTVTHESKSDMDGWTDGVAYTDLTVVANEYILDTNGSFATYNSWSRTGYVPCDGASSLTIPSLPGTGGDSKYNAFYTENKTFISNFVIKHSEVNISVPANAYYFAVSELTSALEHIIETGIIPNA